MNDNITTRREREGKVWKSDIEVVWTRDGTRRRRKKDSGDCVNRDVRAIGTTEDEVHDVTGRPCKLCQPQ